jgi:hypothetical protein
MCSAARVAGAALALLLGALPLAGQQVSGERERLRARVDSLAALRAQVEARIEAAQARRMADLERFTEPLDTQRVGPLTVISAPDQREVARIATEQALASFGAIAQASRAELDSIVLLIELGEATEAFDALARKPGHRRIWLPRWRPAAWRADVVARTLGAVIAASLPADVHAWLGGGALIVRGDDALRAAYRDLVVHPSPAAQACRDGAPLRCADALGLTDPGPRWERWYAEPQVVLWALQQSPNGAAARDAHGACARALTVDACRPWIEMRGAPPVPLRTETRRTLLLHAVALGDADAWRRLTTDTTGTVLERLVAAAGVPADALLGGWRADVLAARPPHAAGLGGSWLLTLFWLGVFTLFAVRSTRWRLG